MIKPLRKRHLQVWSLWAVLLPLLIIAATVARKTTVKDSFAPPQNGKVFPVVIAEKYVGKNLLQLRGEKPNAVKQLLWINREALKVASATIYLASLPPKGGVAAAQPLRPPPNLPQGEGAATAQPSLVGEAAQNTTSSKSGPRSDASATPTLGGRGAYIGRIETRGNYVFELPAQPDYHFLLYDFIHQQIIDTITITPHEQTPSKAAGIISPTPNPKHQTPNS